MAALTAAAQSASTSPAGTHATIRFPHRDGDQARIVAEPRHRLTLGHGSAARGIDGKMAAAGRQWYAAAGLLGREQDIRHGPILGRSRKCERNQFRIGAGGGKHDGRLRR